MTKTISRATLAKNKALLRKIRTIEKTFNLRVEWLTNAADLTRKLDEGLTPLYQQVFSEPPYGEKFSADEVRAVFQDALDRNGFVFTASLPQTGQPVAFGASLPLTSASGALDGIAGAGIDITATSYFSDGGVAPEWRRRGLSSAMNDLRLTATFAAGFKQVLLRTSACNYRQIASVGKSGGTVLPGLTQSVASLRQDGTSSIDTRSFYMFDTSSIRAARKNQPCLQRVIIVRPGGNDTAIVWDQIPRERQADLSLRLQTIYPGVEQVMFVEQTDSPGIYRGQMAGGEFCGNATRSLGYLLLGQRDGEVELEVSGASQRMKVRARDGGSETQIPILADLDCVRRIGAGREFQADLEGISFLITRPDQPLGRAITAEPAQEGRKRLALDLLRASGLANKPASGLLILSEDGGRLSLDPYVYVRDTGTLYYETGCGSGSTAIGLMLAKESGSSIDRQEIVQPSGMSLTVSVERDRDRFLGASVGGPIDVLFDGKMPLPAPRSALAAKPSKI